MLFFEPTFLIFLITVKVAITLVDNDMKKLILLASSYLSINFILAERSSKYSSVSR